MPKQQRPSVDPRAWDAAETLLELSERFNSLREDIRVDLKWELAAIFSGMRITFGGRIVTTTNQSTQPTEWVLRETLASERQGKPMYFWKWTTIGPMTTDKLDDAERFESKQLAMAHPAYSHYVSCYEPEAL